MNTDTPRGRVGRLGQCCHSQRQSRINITSEVSNANHLEYSRNHQEEGLQSFLYPEDDQEKETANQDYVGEDGEGRDTSSSEQISNLHQALSEVEEGHSDSREDMLQLSDNIHVGRECDHQESQQPHDPSWLFSCEHQSTASSGNEGLAQDRNHESEYQGVGGQEVCVSPDSLGNNFLPELQVAQRRDVYPPLWEWGECNSEPNDNRSQSCRDEIFRNQEEDEELERGDGRDATEPNSENIEGDISSFYAPSSSASNAIVPLTFMDVEHSTSDSGLDIGGDQEHSESGISRVTGQQAEVNDEMAPASPDEEELGMTNFLELVNHREDRSNQRGHRSQASNKGRSFRDGISGKFFSV